MENNEGMLLRPEGVQKEFCMGKTTTFQRISELEEWIRKGRYPRLAVIRDGKITLVNRLAFADYLCNRNRLRNQNLQRRVPPFDPEEVARNIGYEKIGG